MTAVWHFRMVLALFLHITLWVALFFTVPVMIRMLSFPEKVPGWSPRIWFFQVTFRESVNRGLSAALSLYVHLLIVPSCHKEQMESYIIPVILEGEVAMESNYGIHRSCYGFPVENPRLHAIECTWLGGLASTKDCTSPVCAKWTFHRFCLCLGIQ